MILELADRITMLPFTNLHIQLLAIRVLKQSQLQQNLIVFQRWRRPVQQFVHLRPWETSKK